MGASSVIIRVGAQTRDAITEFGKLDRAVKDSVSGMDRAKAALRKAALPAAAALAAIGAAAVSFAKDAAEDAASADKLAGQLRRVAGASKDAVAGAEEFLSALSQQVGVADDELRPALGRLATATGSVSKAQDSLRLALDLSAQTGRPLEATSAALAKAYAGSGGALAKMLPGLDAATLKSGDLAKINAELAKKVGGASSEAANTAAGRFARLGITIQETKESIGAALLPVLDALLPIIQSVASWVQRNTGLVKILATVVAGVAAAILVANAAIRAYSTITTIATAATKALNLAFLTSPVGLIVAGIAALVAIVVIAYRRSESFREALDSLGRGFMEVGRVIVGFVQEAWDRYLRPMFDAIGAAVRLVAAILRGDWSAAWQAAKDLVKNAVDALIGYVTTIPAKLLALVANIGAAALRLGQEILTKLGEGVGNLATWISGKIGAAAEWMKSLPGTITSAAVSAGAGILSALGRGLGNLGTWIADRLGDLAEKLRDAPHAVLSAAASLGSSLLSKIKDGLGGLASWVWEQIKSIPGRLWESIKKAIRDHWPDIPGFPGPPFRSLQSRSLTPSFGTSRAGSSITINVTGALDPEGTARAIRATLDAHERRQGRR